MDCERRSCIHSVWGTPRVARHHYIVVEHHCMVLEHHYIAAENHCIVLERHYILAEHHYGS